VLSLAISALFGLTDEARAAYAGGIWAILSRLGWKRPVKDASHLPTIVFANDLRPGEDGNEQAQAFIVIVFACGPELSAEQVPS